MLLSASQSRRLISSALSSYRSNLLLWLLRPCLCVSVCLFYLCFVSVFFSASIFLHFLCFSLYNRIFVPSLYPFFCLVYYVSCHFVLTQTINLCLCPYLRLFVFFCFTMSAFLSPFVSFLGFCLLQLMALLIFNPEFH